MRNIVFSTVAITALALALPAMAGEKPSGTFHCTMTSQGECVNRDPAVGWNVGTPYACQTTLDSHGNVIQYSYWTNGEYWETENLENSLGALLVQGCNTDGGNQFVEVTNGITGSFDAVQNRIFGH